MMDMREILEDLRPQQDAMVRLLERMVRAESPTVNKVAVDRFGRLVAEEWRKRGARVKFLRQRERGNHLRVELCLSGGRPKGQILLLGHLDTVHDVGTLERMPFRISEGRAWGPGTFDMKSGLVMGLFAVDALRRLRIQPRRRIVGLFTTDEEIGSQSSRAVIEREARRSVAVLVLEPASGLDGKLKTQRKGVGDIEIIVTGRAAHAGINPQDGINAVHELAAQIQRVERLNDPRRGITVNADVIEGGTRSNVIAERARAVVDVRITQLSDQRPLERKFHALRPIHKGARLEIRGGINRPPMERTAGVVALFRKAQALAQEMGVQLEESSTGGGSDGNFTAALGVPTLDGLGPIGEGAHAPNENAVIRALPERAALLAGLIATL